MSKSKTYVIVEVEGMQAIKCLQCGRISFNTNDVEQKYCGNCHLFHELGNLTDADARAALAPIIEAARVHYDKLGKPYPAHLQSAVDWLAESAKKTATHASEEELNEVVEAAVREVYTRVWLTSVLSPAESRLAWLRVIEKLLQSAVIDAQRPVIAQWLNLPNKG